MITQGEGNPQRNVWQVSGGPANRDYSDIFLKYGVALIGPGDAGRWRPDREDYEFEGGFVRRFASEVQLGDIFLLRTGISKVRAVGIVASEYLYLPQFDDVNGWDLQHVRRVRWCELPTHMILVYQFLVRTHRACRNWQAPKSSITQADLSIRRPQIGNLRRCLSFLAKNRFWNIRQVISRI